MIDDGEVWLVCGGRAFKDEKLFRSVMNLLIEDRGMPALIIHGKAKGADAMADAWATARGIEVRAVPAEWTNLDHADAIIDVHPATGERYDRRAGPRRNQKMLDDFPVDLCIAMPGKFGTADMVFRAVQKGVPTVIVESGVMRLVTTDGEDRTSLDVS